MELRPYGATAAREHGKSGAETRPSRLTIDAHCHLHVQEAHDLVDGILNPMAIPAVRYSNPRTTAQNVKQNQEAGFIKFGSRIDVLIPNSASIKVSLNDKIVGGETILATI